MIAQKDAERSDVVKQRQDDKNEQKYGKGYEAGGFSYI